MSDLSDVMQKFRGLTFETDDTWEDKFIPLLAECGKAPVIQAVADVCKVETWNFAAIERMARSIKNGGKPQQYKPSVELDYMGWTAPAGYIPKLVALMMRKQQMDTDGYCAALASLAADYDVLDDLTVRRINEISQMAQRRRERGVQRGNLF